MKPKKNSERVPYFVEIRGCINCDASKHHKKITGHDFGYDHESMFKCFTICGDYNIDLTHPFIDPEEVVRRANEDGRKEVVQKAEEYCLHVKDLFGIFYQKMNINLEEIISKLKSK